MSKFSNACKILWILTISLIICGGIIVIFVLGLNNVIDYNNIILGTILITLGSLITLGILFALIYYLMETSIYYSMEDDTLASDLIV
jgi:ABC-type nickel/cobalt efflux system permease component RcnA